MTAPRSPARQAALEEATELYRRAHELDKYVASGQLDRETKTTVQSQIKALLGEWKRLLTLPSVSGTGMADRQDSG
jgi:hypothetical protein